VNLRGPKGITLSFYVSTLREFVFSLREEEFWVEVTCKG